MSLWFILDLTVIGIYILSILFFKAKGFLKASETIISLILTLCLMSYALPFFEEIITDSKIGQSISEKITGIVANPQDEKTETDGNFLPDFMQNSLNNQLESINEAKDNMMTATAEQTSILIIRIISAILFFLLVKLGIFILFRVLELFFRLKPLNFVNRTLGIILGIVNATILIYILCAIAVFIVPADYSQTFKTALSQTYITQFFYNNNILMKLFL